MKRAFLVVSVAAVMAALVISGCNSRSRPRRPGTDSGVVRVDGGPGTDGGPGIDTGMIMLPDTGMPPRDAGPECVSSTMCGGGYECVGGRCVPSTACPTDTVMRVSGVYCSATTRTCVEGCSDGPCIVACLEADASSDCVTCANANITSCINDSGCQTQWNCFVQCGTEYCPEFDAACIDSYCRAQNSAYDTCATGVTTCGTQWTTCVGL